MKKIYLIILLFINITLHAQNSGDIAQSFGRFSGFNDEVNVITLQPNGKILVGGKFTQYNKVYENHLVRLNSDGTKDMTFNIGLELDNNVDAITLQDDGKILVLGELGVKRFNTNGSIDTSFTAPQFNGDGNLVKAFAIQTDGKIIVGGNFTSFNGVFGDNRIIRLNTDGTKDNSFNSGSGFNSLVKAICIQADGKILVGGNFNSYDSSPSNNYLNSCIIRLNADGTEDFSFDNVLGFNGSVNSIKLQPNSKILVIGDFTSYNGVTGYNRIIRLNTDGLIDYTFNTGAGFGIGGVTIDIQTDGKIIVGGNIAFSGGGSSFPCLIRLNSDGSTDTSLANYLFNYEVNSILIQPDGKILAGGRFIQFNGITENCLIRLKTDGTKDTTFETGDGFDSAVYAIAPQPDGKILVGGTFTTYKRATTRSLIFLNTDGTIDNSFNSGNQAGFNGAVLAIANQSDGKIIVGGSFSAYNLVTAKCIIRLNSDGTKDNSFATGAGFNSSVTQIIVQPDGKIIVGGLFISFNGATAKGIIRLNNDGTKDNSFNPSGTGFGLSDNICVVKLQSDGKILVAGNLFSYNGINVKGIMRLNTDGTQDTSFVSGFSGLLGYSLVKTIALQPDGKIILGGQFNLYNGLAENSFIRLNTDGTKDISFNTGTGFDINRAVYAILPLSNGKIVVGGNFASYNGVSSNSIICLNSNGTIDNTFNSGPGFNINSAVFSIVPYNDEKILVGGEFITYNGDNSSVFLIGLHSDSVMSTNDFSNSSNIVIWPNPVKDILKIDSKDAFFSTIKIFDLSGKLVIESSERFIDVSFIPIGFYIIRITTENGDVQKKFIKS